jgi:hypothetical protein
MSILSTLLLCYSLNSPMAYVSPCDTSIKILDTISIYSLNNFYYVKRNKLMYHFVNYKDECLDTRMLYLQPDDFSTYLALSKNGCHILSNHWDTLRIAPTDKRSIYEVSFIAKYENIGVLLIPRGKIEKLLYGYRLRHITTIGDYYLVVTPIESLILYPDLPPEYQFPLK